MTNLSLKILSMAGALVLITLVAGCGTSFGFYQEPTATPTPLPYIVTGNPAVGRAIFHGEKKLNRVLACSTCHYVSEDQSILVGPNMAGISQRAKSRVPHLSAVDYLEQSIREPEAYMVEGFPPGTMNQRYDNRLNEAHVKDLIAYMMTL